MTGPAARIFLCLFGREASGKIQEGLLEPLTVGKAVQEMVWEFHSADICWMSALFKASNIPSFTWESPGEFLKLAISRA